MATDIRIKETLPELTDRIVETYTQLSYDHAPRPLPAAELRDDRRNPGSLKDIIFPGYRRRDGLHLGNITYHVGELIDRLHDHLTEQIARALRHEAGEAFTCSPQQKADFEALGQAKAVAFLRADSRSPRVAGHRRAGGLRRRSGLQVAGRGDLLLSGAGGDHRLSGWPTGSTSSKCRSSPAS